MPYIKLNGGADIMYYEAMHLKKIHFLYWDARICWSLGWRARFLSLNLASKHRRLCGALLSSVWFEAAIRPSCAPHHGKLSTSLVVDAEGGSYPWLKTEARLWCSHLWVLWDISSLQQWYKVFHALGVLVDSVPGSCSVLIFFLITHSLLISPQKFVFFFFVC